MVLLLKNESVPHKTLTNELGSSSQALSWNIKKLKLNGLIDVLSDGKRKHYSLKQEKKDSVEYCLQTLKRK